MKFRITRLEKALTATPSVVEAISDRRTNLIPRLGGSNIAQQRIGSVFVQAQSASYGYMYQSQPAVRSVVDYIAGNIAQLGLRAYERVSDDEREHAGDHPAAESLRWPNPQTPGQQFIFNLVAEFLVYDNAYALKFQGPGARITLLNVPASAVGIVGQERFTAEAYRIWRDDGSFFDVPVEAMIHWRGYDPNEPRAGFSKLETLRQELAADAAARAAKTELDRSGLSFRGWLERPVDAPEWSDVGRQRFKEDAANMGKNQNRHLPVFEEGMQFKTAGVSPEEAQMLSFREFAKGAVAEAYGMEHCPPQGEEERRQFYADVLQPLCERLCSYLDLQVLRQEFGEDDYYFEFNLDEKKMSDDRIKTLTSASGTPILLVNESRAFLNLPPVPDGDKMILPGNVGFVGDPAKPSLPSVGVMPIQDPNKPSQDGDHREEPKALTNGTGALVKAEPPLVQLHPSRKAEHDRHLRNIDLAKAAVERHFNRLGRSLRKKASVESAWERFDREFGDDLFEVAQRIVETEGAITAFKLGGTFDVSLIPKYLRAMSSGAAEAINQTIRNEIDEFGFEDALGHRAQHVESAGSGFGAGATRWAREEAARHSPGTEQRVKIWVPNTQRHANFAGQTVPLGADWPAGFAPGAAPGCKCSMSIE